MLGRVILPAMKRYLMMSWDQWLLLLASDDDAQLLLLSLMKQRLQSQKNTILQRHRGWH